MALRRRTQALHRALRTGSLRWWAALALGLAAVLPSAILGGRATLRARGAATGGPAATAAVADALASATARDTWVIAGAALAISAGLGAWLATRWIRSLGALGRRADAIAAGSSEPAPVRGPGEIGALGDRIEQLAQRVADRAALQAALARGDRLASLGVLSAQVAHELNNPLTTTLGYAMLLQEDKPADHPDREALALIVSEAERMRSIVGRLLDYARSHRSAERQLAGGSGLAGGRCDPVAVLRSLGGLLEPVLGALAAPLGGPLTERPAGAAADPALDSAAPTADRGALRARIALAIAPGADAALAIEPLALQQVLIDLVQYAAHAIASDRAAGGAIDIAARPLPGAAATLVTISYAGPSVPAADRPRMFDPLFPAQPAAGARLDLAVAKHLVVTAGGAIEIGDVPSGGGAQFRVVIPHAG
jgi:signal transduction histidine kinase